MKSTMNTGSAVINASEHEQKFEVLLYDHCPFCNAQTNETTDLRGRPSHLCIDIEAMLDDMSEKMDEGAKNNA